MLIAAAEEAERGWANTLGLLAGVIVIYLIWLADRHFNDRPEDPSPPPLGEEGQGDDTDSDLGDDPDDTEVVGWREEVRPNGSTFIRYVRSGINARFPEDDETEGNALEAWDEPAEHREPETLEDWVYGNLDRLKYAEMVRDGMRLWRVSERTMKRRIAEARNGS